jgi:hypothetical protein
MLPDTSLQTEIVRGPCGHEWDADSDLGSHFCPKCKKIPPPGPKPLDVAVSKIEARMNEEIKKMFAILNACTLNSRQEEIVLSMESYFKKNGKLTPAQKNLLDDIYEKASTKK